mgnify:CR=1 FL=1
MKTKKLLSLVMSTAMVLGSTISVNADTVNNDAQSESTAIIDTSKMITGGYIATELDNNVPVYNPDITTYSLDSIPTSYQADVSYNDERYPENRNQGLYGTCWAFAATGLAEFDLINDKSYSKDIDFSELQLAYFTYNSVLDPLGGTEGDVARYNNSVAKNNYLNAGGNFLMASRRYGQWVGPINEDLVPYEQASTVLQSGVSDSYAYNFDKAHLTNTYIINIKENTNDVKQAIIDHGAVGVTYNSQDQAYAYSGNNITYYDTDTSGGGHSVMIVGWDDNYSVDNFTGKNKPQKNGAWRVRNSWGFNTSYFWMSYETVSLAEAAWVFDFTKDDGYDNNYQLDGGVSVYPDQISGYKKVANIFTTQVKDEIESETLKAVSLSFTQVADVGYKIEIYTDLKKENKPYSGTLQESATTEGRTSYAGVYTIELTNTVKLKPGTSFAVVVTLDKFAMDQEQAASTHSEDNSNVLVWDCPVSLNNGKSQLMYQNGSTNYYWGNYCIKAFTSNNLGDSFDRASISMDGKVDLNFYMTLPDSVKNSQDAYMEFTLPNGTVKKVKVEDAKQKDGYYVFTCDLAAKEMNDEIKAQMVSGTVRGKQYTYRATDYANYILNHASSYDEITINAVKALLNYGAYSQQQFGYNTDNLANENMPDADKSLNNADLTSYKYNLINNNAVAGIKYESFSLILESETTMRHYIKVADGHNINEYTISLIDQNGKTRILTPSVASNKGSGYYYVDVPNTRAYDLDKFETITIESNSDSSKKIEMSCCPLSYSELVMRNYSQNDKLVNVSKALYWYWKQANAYKSK